MSDHSILPFDKFCAWLKGVLIVLLAVLFFSCPANCAPRVPSPALSAGSQIDQILPQPSEPKELKPGQLVEGELTQSGDSHTYLVKLNAGEYLNVLIEQQALDLMTTLIGPSGKTIAEIDWESAGDTESLWATALVAGDYQLRLKAISVFATDARYVVKLEKIGPLHTAPAVDQDYVNAHQLFYGASELTSRGNEQSWRQAVEAYSEALPLWQKLNQKVGEGLTLHELAFLYGKLGNQEKSIELYKEALTVWRREEKHRAQESDTLFNLGSTYAFSGKTVEAIQCYKEASRLRQLLKSPGTQAFALNSLGQAYNNLGDFRAALDSYQEALRLRRETGEIEGQARTLSSISSVYFALGEFQQALNYLEQSLVLRRAAGDRKGEAITLANIGSNYRELGEPNRALDYYRQAAALQIGLNDRSSQAGVTDAIGRTYFDLGDNQKSLDSHQRALALRRKINDAFGEASSLAHIGMVYARTGDRQLALQYFEESLKLRRAIGDRRGEALTLQNAGELYRRAGELQKAFSYFEQGLSISRNIKNRFLEGNLLYGIARTEKDAGHLDEARSRVETAIAVVEATRSKVASFDLRASFLASKHDLYEFEIELLMQLYRRDRKQESLLKAFSVSEQQRARSLLDNLEEAHANIRQGSAPELLIREHAVRTKLNQLAENQIKLLSRSHTPDEAAVLAKDVEAITNEYEQVLAEIRTSSQKYAALTQPVPFSLSDVQKKVLDRDTLLLEYSLGTERSYVWAVTDQTISGFELPPRAEIEALARRVYDLLTSRNRFVRFENNRERLARVAKADSEYLEAARQLSRLLLPPAAAQISKRRLLIVSDGALQYLPFAALPLPNRQSKPPAYVPLITKYEIVSVPSASTLGVLRKEIAGRRPAPKTIAVLADPVFDRTDERLKEPGIRVKGDDITRNSGGEGEETSQLTRSLKDFATTKEDAAIQFRRLPFTRLEAEAIVALTPANEHKEAVDFAANRATAVDPQLSQYRYVHFATHGLLNVNHPELSGIVLSLVDQNGNDQNGFLLADEIYNLNLPAELVVLSGCRTGLGKEVKGEGLLSLTRGFMYAGAARVVVSLWDVNDKSTAELMKHFYRGAIGKKQLGPAAALRQAQVAMSHSDRWGAPYYWAAFVLQGEYH
jgi:CHAT domain-containing protein/Tfp pilus assembly protein PilF